MDYVITVRVAGDEKVIEIPWEDLKVDFIAFILERTDSEDQETFRKVFNIVESRIRNVFLDRYKESLIQ